MNFKFGGAALELLGKCKALWLLVIVAKLAARAQVLPIERALQEIMAVKRFRAFCA